jgi:hypothetical protein
MVGWGLIPLFTIAALWTGPLGWAQQPASIVARLTNPELVSRSSLVVYGRVTAVRSDGRASEAVVAVDHALKGAPGNEVIVTFSPGLAESSTFERGETVLVFLTEAGQGRLQTTGGEQGKFSLGKG